MYSGVNIDAAVYADAAATPNLLVVEKAYYTAPSPLITPIVAGTTAGLLTVDGVPLAAGDRVFSQDTCNGVASGLYTAAAGAWARTADFAVGMDVSGAFSQVVNGTHFGGTSWNCTNAPGAAVVGSVFRAAQELKGGASPIPSGLFAYRPIQEAFSVPFLSFLR